MYPQGLDLGSRHRDSQAGWGKPNPIPSPLHGNDERKDVFAELSHGEWRWAECELV